MKSYLESQLSLYRSNLNTIANNPVAPEITPKKSIEIESRYQNELDELALLTYLIQNFDPNHREIYLTEKTLNLTASKNRVTIQFLTEDCIFEQNW